MFPFSIAPFILDFDSPIRIIVGSPHHIPDWVYYFKTNRYGTRPYNQKKTRNTRRNTFRRRMF